MMDHTSAETIARAVLARGKAALPARFPLLTDETIAVWADVFARYGVNYPPQVWPEAVDHYVAKMDDGDNQAGPRGILTAAREVVALWEADPDRAGWLAERRHGNLSRREAAGTLPVGTAPENPSGGRLAAIPAPHGEGRQRFREQLDRFATRNLAALDDPDATPHDRARARKRAEERERRRAARDARTARNHPQIGA